jgi:hypothetical protein
VGHLLGLLFVLFAVIQVSPATAVWSNPICRLISPQLASRLIPIAIFNGLTADAADPQVAEAPAAEKTYMVGCAKPSSRLLNGLFASSGTWKYAGTPEVYRRHIGTERNLL